MVFRLLEHEGPIVLCVYMVQQINCIRNKEGEIIEVSEMAGCNVVFALCCNVLWVVLCFLLPSVIFIL